jgi:hypothetical protein
MATAEVSRAANRSGGSGEFGEFMKTVAGLKPVPGSHRNPLRNAKAAAKADPNQRMEVTVRVRSRAGADWGALLMEMGLKP